MSVLPPGIILQNMFLSKKIASLSGKTFIEVGAGGGEITKILLAMGMSGTVFEISPQSVNTLKSRFSNEIGKNIVILEESFLEYSSEVKVDLIICSMVLEHLNSSDENLFILACKKLLTDKADLIILVPSNSRYWGIEDEVAGHYRRYNRNSLYNLIDKSSLEVKQIVGLTYPLSNLLLPISNYLVRKNEMEKINLTFQERTLVSGHRNVTLKTKFPWILKILLNRFSMYPFYLLQIIFKNSNKAMILLLHATNNKINSKSIL